MKNTNATRILWSLFLGLLVGGIALYLGWGDAVKDYLAPFGTVFLKALKMTALPLIVVSLLASFGQLRDLSDLKQLGGRTLIAYLATTVFAILLGLLIANLIDPGSWLSESTRIDLTAGFTPPAARDSAESGPLNFLVELVPENFLATAADNRNMLSVIFSVILLAIALLRAEEEKRNRLGQLFADLNELVMEWVNLLMWFAPLGVFALMANLVVTTPQLDLLAALMGYCLTVVAVLGLLTVVVYPLLIQWWTQFPYQKFMKGVFPAQITAFSTSSSAATLGVSLDCAQNNLGVSPATAAFVLPAGASLNMDGTASYIACAAVFLASAYGMELSLMAQLTIVFTVTAASIGAAAVPGAGIIMLTIVMEQAGIPLSGLALVLAVDRPLDMLRTCTNVTSDAAVAMLVDQ